MIRARSLLAGLTACALWLGWSAVNAGEPRTASRPVAPPARAHAAPEPGVVSIGSHAPRFTDGDRPGRQSCSPPTAPVTETAVRVAPGPRRRAGRLTCHGLPADGVVLSFRSPDAEERECDWDITGVSGEFEVRVPAGPLRVHEDERETVIVAHLEPDDAARDLELRLPCPGGTCRFRAELRPPGRAPAPD